MKVCAVNILLLMWQGRKDARHSIYNFNSYEAVTQQRILLVHSRCGNRSHKVNRYVYRVCTAALRW